MVFQMSVIRTAIYTGYTANTGTKDTFPGNEQQTDTADAADAVRHRVGYAIPPGCRLLIAQFRNLLVAPEPEELRIARDRNRRRAGRVAAHIDVLASDVVGGLQHATISPSDHHRVALFLDRRPRKGGKERSGDRGNSVNTD